MTESFKSVVIVNCGSQPLAPYSLNEEYNLTDATVEFLPNGYVRITGIHKQYAKTQMKYNFDGSISLEFIPPKEFKDIWPTTKKVIKYPWYSPKNWWYGIKEETITKPYIGWHCVGHVPIEIITNQKIIITEIVQ